ncbi:MAG: ATP-binding protein [Elusimicrobia bacterium]|nr:ATP-binding protein [Elusimicrobiota bacterium]
MPESQGLILLVTTDEALYQDLAPAAASKGLKLAAVAAPAEAAAQLTAAAGAAATLVVDFGRVPVSAREGLLALRAQAPQVLFVFLETNASISPDTPAPLRRLPWPLPVGFADQVRATDRPVVMLADKTLFSTAALTLALQQAGVQLVSLESTTGLVEFLHEQQQARTPKPKPSGIKSFWGRLSGEESDVKEMPVLGRVVVAMFSGSVADAEGLDRRIREVVPEAVCYHISSLDAGRAAVAAIKDKQIVSLSRDLAGRLPELLAASGESEQAPSKEGGRILLVDNNKPYVMAMGQALIGAGYEVVTATDSEESLQLFRTQEKGYFHVAIIGTAIAYGQHSGAEFVQQLRELDKREGAEDQSHLRIIFMVDQFPAETVTRRLGEVVKLGLDDALVKPVEPVQLLASVQRALDRRYLLLENARQKKEIEENNRQLAQLNDFQKKFFAMVAHDVKNPLTAIMGYSEVLGMRLKSNPGELKYASHIHSAAKTLNTLISDLVDLAAIESGKLRVEIGALDLLGVLGEVRSRIEIVAGQRKIEFGVEAPAALPLLAGDPARLGQVIQNLCTNAIQYTKEGGKVTVRVEAQPEKVVVSVIDTGIGIAAEDLPRIWERFFQTEEAKKMRKAGFGLGLKIAREVVQMHGGEMGIESQLGVGSRFFFFLPVRTAPAAAAPAARPDPLPSLTNPPGSMPAPAQPPETPAPAPRPAQPTPPPTPAPRSEPPPKTDPPRSAPPSGGTGVLPPLTDPPKREM